MMIIVYVFIGVLLFVSGMMCGHQLNDVDNLTKEEYMHCVQIVVNDMERDRQGIQDLLNELQNYAGSVEVEYEHLSREAREIVDKVREILL